MTDKGPTTPKPAKRAKPRGRREGFVLWILGAPGAGKSTVAKALKTEFEAPLIELGRLRECHLLHTDWRDANETEAALSLTNMKAMIANYMEAGYEMVIATDLPFYLVDLRNDRLNKAHKTLTLLVNDEAAHAKRVLGERDSGFRDTTKAAGINRVLAARGVRMDEVAIDTSRQSEAQTVKEAVEVVKAWRKERPKVAKVAG